MDCIIIDIETRPDPRIWDDPDTVEEIRDGIDAPRNYKDPLKIEAYIDERLAELRKKAALQPRTGKVACVGWMRLDAYRPDQSIDENAARVSRVFADDEASVLSAMVRELQRPTLIGGYNLREFDIPFLVYRCAVHGIDLPDWWPQRRSWDRIVDPCDLFPRGDVGRLDEHLRAMGLPRKTMSGEESLELPLDELADYCANDVACEAALVQRFDRHFPTLNPRKKESA